MSLPRDYAEQTCSLARALEVVGERWTLLLVRDALYGVRRFGDFADHLGIPRAVLTARLKSLVAADVLARVPGDGGRSEYELTDKGLALWPAVRSLLAWGDDYYAPRGPLRLFLHAADEGLLDAVGRCAVCGAVVPAQDTIVAAGPGLVPGSDDLVSASLVEPRPLLRPVRG